MSRRGYQRCLNTKKRTIPLKINTKIISVFFSATLLSGCSLSMTTTKVYDKKNNIKITKELKATKNNNAIKILGTVATFFLAYKIDNGTGMILPAILRYDIANKEHALNREKVERQQKMVTKKM
jgi:hypothetical protein